MGTDLGLALSGGGARAAYQVGFLRFLARRWPDLRIPILTGVSAGAINAVKLANSARNFGATVERLNQLWSGISAKQVFRTGAIPLSKMVGRWGLRLLLGGSRAAPPTRGLVDTTPLWNFLNAALDTDMGKLVGIGENLAAGRLKAVAITTTNYGTGQSITWVQGKGVSGWERPQRRGILEDLTVEHVMASTSLPLFFPAVRIGEAWHGDGGIRLTAPLSPALHLGAGRVMAISTRYARTIDEANAPNCEVYPPPAQVIGILMNALFLDMLDFDAMNMEKMNRLIERIPEEARGDLRIVRVLILRPSSDLGRLAGDYEPRLPGPFRFLMRGLGTRETKSPDSLSMVMFEPRYIAKLLEMGERDAEARASEIGEFLESK